MSFTQITVSGTYVNGSSQPQTGSVQITPTAPMVNSGVTVPATAVTKALDSTGSVSFQLAAVDDAGTYPTGVLYEVVEAIVGLSVNTYWISVPAAGGAINLNTVTRLPDPGRVPMVTQSVAQKGQPSGYAGLDSTGRVPLAQLPPGLTSSSGSTPAGVSSFNGLTGAVVANAGTVGAIPASSAGAANGVAQLDATGKVPSAQLPASSGGGVTSFNGQTGAVTATAATVGAVATSAVGSASGVASLDSNALLPINEIPDLSAHYLSRDVIGAGTAGQALVSAPSASGGAQWKTVGPVEVVVAASNSRTTRAADYVCTGTADDTVIQQAINLVTASGGSGTVKLLDGAFTLAAPLQVPVGIGLQITGTSRLGTVLQLANSVNDYAIRFVGTGVTQCQITNLTINGNLANQTAGGGIMALGAQQCNFERLHLTGCWEDGIVLAAQTGGTAGYGNIVRDCIFDGGSASTGPGRGVRMTSSTGNTVSGCQFTSLGGSGSAPIAHVLDQAGLQKVIGCDFTDGGHNATGVYILGANTKVLGCHFNQGAGDGVYSGASGTTIVGCTATEVGINGTPGQASAIHLGSGAVSNTVVGNTLSSSATNGVTRSLIREENAGGSGKNHITTNTVIQVGTVAVALIDVNAPGSTVTANTGGGAAGDPSGARTVLGVFNVKDYGAAQDGVTDDTSAIQAAATAAGAIGGGVVQLGPYSYALNSAALALSSPGVVLRGAGAEVTKLLIGSGFTGAAAVQISAYNCQVADLSINGASSTTTSNPVADGVQVTGARRAKVTGCDFWYINGYAVNVAASSSSTGNPDGTMLSRLIARSCAGGIRFLGNTASGYAVNSFISDVQILSGGVTTGASANLDGLHFEDSWDILTENVMAWMSLGTGHALHIKGSCAAQFIKNLDALGPNTGACVLIEDGTNGSAQNVQITGGVIQQGSIGAQISGGSNQIHLTGLRFINNQGHGIQVDGTSKPIHISDCMFTQSGQGATGTNYDINWSGTATGSIFNCWFGSPIVATGSAGVQASINVGTAGQNVKCHNVAFEGTGAARANWATNWPAGFMESSSGVFDFVTGVNFTSSSSTSVAVTGQSAGQRLIGASGQDTASTLLGGGVVSDGFDRFRLTADAVMHFGPGTGSRDSSWQRIAANQMGSLDSDIVAGTAGHGFRVKEGTNARMGIATLAAGTVTVSNTSVTSSTRIFLSRQTAGGTLGQLSVTVTAGTSFTITSSSGSDTSTVAWELKEPA